MTFVVVPIVLTRGGARRELCARASRHPHRSDGRTQVRVTTVYLTRWNLLAIT